MFILVRIFLLILRYLFYYLKSFYPHISDIVMLYFRTHLNIILHTYLSIYYVFVFVSLTCMYMLYFPFTSHSILTHLICFCTRISYVFVLTSHSFCQNLFCNTCIAYACVSHTFGFDFLFSKAKLHTHLYSIF